MMIDFKRFNGPPKQRAWRLAAVAIALTAAACTCITGITGDIERIGSEFAEIQPTFDYLSTRQADNLTGTATVSGVDFNATRAAQAALGTQVTGLDTEGLLNDPTIEAFLTQPGDASGLEDGEFNPDDFRADDIYQSVIPFDCGLVPEETIEDIANVTIEEVIEMRTGRQFGTNEFEVGANTPTPTPDPATLLNLECQFILEDGSQLTIISRIEGSDEAAEISFGALTLITGFFTGEEFQGAYASGIYNPPNNTLFTLNGPYLVNFVAPIRSGEVDKEDLFDLADEWIKNMPSALPINEISTPTSTQAPDDTPTPNTTVTPPVQSATPSANTTVTSSTQ